MRYWVLLLLSLPLAAQTTTFEVASIRPSSTTKAEGQFCHSLKAGTENVQAIGITLNLLIIDAYEEAAERFDLPDWGKTKFDVNAKLPPNTNVAGCRQMLQAFLAERFHLVIQVETRDYPTYILKVAKSGLKLKPAAGPPPNVIASMTRTTTENGRTHYTLRSAPMSRVFIIVSTDVVLGFRHGAYQSDRALDETGLTGYYDGELEFDASWQPGSDAQIPSTSSLQDALPEQAGLTLEVRKVPGKLLSIRSSDHMPTEN